MSPDRWKQIEDLFHEAAELPPSERNGFVATRAVGDAMLESEVAKLLASLDDAGEFIESPSARSA